MNARTIALLIYDDVQAMDLVCPYDTFGSANEYIDDPAQRYELLTVAVSDRELRAENGLAFMPDATIDSAGPLDTLVIPGGRGSRVANRDQRLLDWLREQAASTRRIVSTCTGIYLLAATGLLDGRRATTHWRFAEDVRHRFPAVDLNPDALYTEDAPFYTSGGLTASIDLALTLIEADLGGAIALATARHLVMYMKRPGNQAQFSEPLRAQTSAQGPLSLLPEWVADHLADDLTIERMAHQVNMSERNFRRMFQRTFNASPGRYVERMRLERARVLLTSTPSPIDSVASRVGFVSPDTFRRAFRRHYGASPREYRQRFA